MKHSIEEQYKCSPVDISKLEKYGYHTVNQDDERVTYTNKFPVYKYKKYTVYECEVCILADNGEISIDVFNENGGIFPPFYSYCGNFEPLLNKIRQNILREFKKVGIKQCR